MSWRFNTGGKGLSSESLIMLKEKLYRTCCRYAAITNVFVSLTKLE